MEKSKNILFGAHISISGKIALAFQRAESINCTAMQIFTKSNRQWNAKQLTSEDTQDFKAAWKKSSIKSVIAHASYLINIGSPNHELEKKSILALTEELDRCNQLSIPYLVLHPGSHTNTDTDTCLKRISANLDKVLEKSSGTTSILLETMAGQGSSVCYSFEQIAEIIHQSSHKKKLGVCFDTCHAFAAGYDFSTKATYKAMWKEFDKTIGLHKLHAIHINDSKTDLGSHIDRHADIGKGKIGLEAFELLFKDPKLSNIPKILETPYEDLKDYVRNMETIKKLLI